MNDRKFGRLGRLWQHAGLFCLMVKPYHGRRSGYVHIPEDHPWHGLGYSDKVPNPGESPYLNRPATDAPMGGMIAALLGGVDGWLEKLDAQVEVHGGLTFAYERTSDDWDRVLENSDGIPGGWWIGFDCGHAGDGADFLIMDDENRRVYERHLRALERGEHVWTDEEVAAECNRLAEQVAAAGRVTA